MSYDEDVSRNIFFCALKSSCAELYAKTGEEDGWIICVPVSGVYQEGRQFDVRDFARHILVRDGARITNLCDEEVHLERSKLTITQAQISATILFRETLYDEVGGSKRQVLCLASPLEEEPDRKDEAPKKLTVKISKPRSLTESSRFLCQEVGGHWLLSELKQLVEEAKLSKCHVQTQDNLRDQLQAIIAEGFEKCLSLPKLHASCAQSETFQLAARSATANFLLGSLYERVLAEMSVLMADRDARLNKQVRNHRAETTLEDVGVSSMFKDSLPLALKELLGIAEAQTPIEKLDLLFDALEILSSWSSTDGDEATLVNCDRLLPAVVFMILQTNVPNWHAHFYFVSDFIGMTDAEVSKKHLFYLTTLEAALEHIKTGKLCEPPASDATLQPDEEKLLGLARRGDDDGIKIFLEAEKKNCSHCNCKDTTSPCKVEQQLISTDEQGRSPLLLASSLGHASTVELLLGVGASLTATDHFRRTALHLSAAGGHQSALLFLLYHEGPHQRIDLQGLDLENNSALHLACVAGHESCAKALVFFAEHHASMHLLGLDQTNADGDTPLHLASRWGYKEIVRLLLQFEAKVDVLNGQGKTASQCAHNYVLSAVITKRDC